MAHAVPGRAGTRLRGIFSFARKRISPLTPKRKGLDWQSAGLNNSDVSEVKVPRMRGEAAFSICKTICLCSYYPLLRSRWRLCCLTDAAHPLRVPLCQSCAQVRPNHRLPMALINAASAAMPHSARSLPPSYRHSRLTIVRRGCERVTTRRRFMAKPCTPHPHCAACAVIQAANCQCGGARGSPLVLSLGGVRGIFSF